MGILDSIKKFLTRKETSEEGAPVEGKKVLANRILEYFVQKLNLEQTLEKPRKRDQEKFTTVEGKVIVTPKTTSVKKAYKFVRKILEDNYFTGYDNALRNKRKLTVEEIEKLPFIRNTKKIKTSFRELELALSRAKSYDEIGFVLKEDKIYAPTVRYFYDIGSILGSFFYDLKKKSLNYGDLRAYKKFFTILGIYNEYIAPKVPEFGEWEMRTVTEKGAEVRKKSA